METLLRDVSYGARVLWGKPLFTAIAVLTLALGIGANTAIFSVVNAVLLDPLPYPDAHRVVTVRGNLNREGLAKMTASAPEFNDYQERSHLFEQLAAYDWQSFNLTGDGDPLQPPERASYVPTAMLGGPVMPSDGWLLLRKFDIENNDYDCSIDLCVI